MKISLAIPTRSRGQYLRFALQSALVAAANAGCDVEIVVSDNASDDDTAAMVEGLHSPIIKLVRQPHRLSMRQNFEAALDACTGSHILFIGDDDGVTPHGLMRLREMIEAEDRDIFKWRVANFIWPDPAKATPGHLWLRLNKFSGRVRHLDPMAVFADFRHARMVSYQQGGMIYHGCISRRLVDRVRAASGGTYFWTICPDVHASVANLLFCQGPILAADIPVTLGGASPRSNGVAGKEFARTAKTEANSEFTSFVSELKDDPCLGQMPATCASIHLVTVDCLQLAMRFAGKPLALDHPAWLRRIGSEVAGLSPSLQAEARGQTQVLLGQGAELDLAATPVSSAPPGPILSATPKVTAKLAKVDLSGGRAFADIAGAAALIDRLCENTTPFSELPRGNLAMLRRALQIRRNALSIAATNW